MCLPELSASTDTRACQWSTVPIVTASKVGYPETGFRNTDLNNFAPRIGFAYRLNNRNDFVVRGGYGIFVVNVPNGLLSTYEGERSTWSGSRIRDANSVAV